MRISAKKILMMISFSCILFIVLLSNIETFAWTETIVTKEERTRDVIRKLRAENILLKSKFESTSKWPKQAVNHELEIPPASFFTSTRMYPAEPGQGGRVIEKLTDPRRADLLSILPEALALLDHQFKLEDFVEGSMFLYSKLGTFYEMVFKKHNGDFTKVSLVRPFGPVKLIKTQLKSNKKQMINIIVPLSGRINSFRSFMERFLRLYLYDGKISLTIVYFNDDMLGEAKEIVNEYSGKDCAISFVSVNEKFSRGRALKIGASLYNTTELLFFCDIDVVFNSHFLQRCRRNSELGVQVYYPIVFSLFNPKIVYELHGRSIPILEHQLVVSKDTGFWRDFGYGMTCQYRADFDKAFERWYERTSWGGEDILLYRKFLKNPKIRVLRATDPGIFHAWHPKICTSSMSIAQLHACLRTRARTEADHAQLGLLALSNFNSSFQIG